MIIIIRALPQSGKDDGDYDSPTSRHETPDLIKKGQRSPNKKKRPNKPTKTKKNERNERKREKGQCYYPFTTLVLQSSTMFFIERVTYAFTFIY